MRNIRVWLAAGFAALLGMALAITRSDAQPNTLKKIAPGVWFREGDLKNQDHCNNVIIEMKDYLIVVDANFPSGARLAMEDAKKVSSKPVRFVFDTHHHGDHVYGNAVWTGAGAMTIAYQGVAEEMKRYEPARWKQSMKERKDVADLHRDAPEPPQQTFTDSPHVIADDTRRVEFYHFGWAHTRGDGLVYLPKEHVLCSGDAAVNGPYNFTGDGNIGNWPKVLDAALKLQVDHVLPGHGGAGGKEILTGQRAFMIELRKAVAAEVAHGKKLDDLVKKSNGKQVATLRLPDSVKNWVSADSLPDQVKDAYNEVTTGKPAGDLPH